jgi:phosphopantothenoylcysteine decarboxylase/phosphopantothenate--cysteine ligase
MGIALADASVQYGAEVDLVLGPVDLRPAESSVRITEVVTTESMAEECISRFPVCDIAILSTAVADFRVDRRAPGKIKSDDGKLTLHLEPTTDIARTLGGMKKTSQIIAGFALETDEGIESAIGKMRRKNMDIIVLNTLKDNKAGFGYDTNRITIIDRNESIDKFELKSKAEVAKDILDKIVSLI